MATFLRKFPIPGVQKVHRNRNLLVGMDPREGATPSGGVVAVSRHGDLALHLVFGERTLDVLWTSREAEGSVLMRSDFK